MAVSPDRKLLVIQADAERHTPEEHQKLLNEAEATGLSRPKEDVNLVVVNVDDRTALVRSTAHHAVDFPVIQQGYIESLSARRPQHWILRYVPFVGEPRVIADVASTCQPAVRFLNADTMLLNECEEKTDEHFIHAMTMDGKSLWQQHWDGRYVWPTFAYAENGQRFAYSSLQLSHAIGALEPVDDDMVQAEVVGVFDTVTGKMLLMKDASPVSSAGQNFALSADGTRFAIVRAGAVEVYDLPSSAADPSAATAVSPAATPGAH